MPSTLNLSFCKPDTTINYKMSYFITFVKTPAPKDNPIPTFTPFGLECITYLIDSSKSVMFAA